MSEGADVNVEVAGQKVNLRNVKSLNTLLTAATFILLVCGGYTFWLNQDAHAKDSHESNRVQVAATQENTKALREMAGELRVKNCYELLSAEQKRSSEMLAFCKSLATVR